MNRSIKTPHDASATLTSIPASDVKRLGWRGVIDTLGQAPALLVTNHERPQAVIVSTAEYARLTAHARAAQSRTETELERLRQQFDQRLAVLATANAGPRLRAVMKGPARLRGKVKAGARY